MVNPRISMIWGDVGTGKSTLSLQCAKEAIKNKNKVFFLTTKQVSMDGLIQRCIQTDISGFNSEFFFWKVETFNQQIQTITL